MSYATRKRLHTAATIAAILFLAGLVAGCVTSKHLVEIQCGQTGPVHSVGSFAASLSACVEGVKL